jgi:beta-glucosidase
MSSPVGKQVRWTFDPNAAAGTAWTATGVPPGVTLDAAGRFTGAATARGTYTVTVTARNAAGATGAATFVWTTT